MLYYCEKCNVLNEQDYCQYCGKKSLRNPNKSDYCFLTEVNSMFGQMFMGILDEEHIAYSAMPSGNGVRSKFALKLENLKIFVTYEYFNSAKEILDEIFANFEKEQSKGLIDNIDKLFVLPRNEKKMKKKLKLNENDNFLAYCSDLIMNADRVVNKGRISGCIKGGQYLCVYKESELMMVNSVTYEIIFAERTKE